MDYKDILSLAAIVISVGTFAITFLVFRRNRKFENENHLYKIKMEKYHEIMVKISDILLSFDSKLDIADFAMKNPTKENAEEVLDLADDIDEEVVSFSFYVSSHTLVFPEKIVQMLEDLIDYLTDGNVEEGETTKQSGILENCYTLADKIHEAMRKDLHIDALNISLFNRIKK